MLAEKIEFSSQVAMIPMLEDSVDQMPSLDEVLKYAEQSVKFVLNSKEGRRLPREQQEEVMQDAYFRVIKKYPEMKADQGWKTLVQTHCYGALKDYSSQGRGFQESRSSLHNHKGKKIRSRVSIDDLENVSLDQLLGKSGVFNSSKVDDIKINWDLLSRMASQDLPLRAFAMSINGVTLEEQGPVFNLKRARAGQLVQAFIDRFDDPEYADDHWFKQCCFALGVCELLGLPNVDQSIVMGFSVGWNLPPVDLSSVEPHPEIKELDSQLTMGFDE